MLKSFDQVIKERIMQIIDYHSNTICLPFHQRPGRVVGAVSQFTDGILNQFPHLRFYILAVIDNPRNCGKRNIGCPRHILNTHCFSCFHAFPLFNSFYIKCTNN